MNIRYDIQQNTPEWVEIKLGKFSASKAADLLMKPTMAGYQNLIDKIIEERFTCKPQQGGFKGNDFTERGHELEPDARTDFELRTGLKVDICGVIELDDWVLCSPDGLIGDNGLWQGKCPIFKTQRSYLQIVSENPDLTDNELLYKLSSVYYKQTQFEFYVSGREYEIFTSYHPALPEVELRIIRDEEMIDEIDKKLFDAKLLVTNEIEKLKSYGRKDLLR